METGILKQIDLDTTAERYYYVEAQHSADQIQVHSVQTFKPLELTFKVSELRISHDQASAAAGNLKYEFNDDSSGLLTQLKMWAR